MTDAFDEAKNDILRGGEANGGLTTRSVFDLIVASHGQTIGAVDDVTAKVDVLTKTVARHVEWTERESLPRLIACEKGLAQVEMRCSGHDDLHVSHLASDHTHKPRREDDPDGVDFSDTRDEEGAEMRVVYRMSKWAVRGIIGALIVLLVGVAFNFYVNRQTTNNATKVSKEDLHTLIVLLQNEHKATPSPLPTGAP